MLRYGDCPHIFKTIIWVGWLSWPLIEAIIEETIMPEFKIVHDRPNCIGCGACAAVSPDFWEMSPTDGKSDLKGSVHKKEGGQTVEEERKIGDAEYKPNKEAADSCPVNVIHLFDASGKKII